MRAAGKDRPRNGAQVERFLAQVSLLDRETDLGESVKVVHDSIKAGINLIDAAPWYGHGKAEKVLGEAFKDVPRQAFYYTTKVCRYDPCEKPCARYRPIVLPTDAACLGRGITDMFDFRAERTLQSIDESLARTGLEYIDTVQIHDPEFAPSLDIVINETLPALQKAKDMGKVKHIGMTGYPLEVQKKLIEGGMKNGVKVDTSLVYCHYSMNDTTLSDGKMSDGRSFLDFLDEHGIGCVNASPISMGLLTARGPPDWHPARKVPRIVEACKQAGDFCAEKGMDYSKLAMHFTLRNKAVPTTLVTSANPGRMASNVQTVYDTLSDAEDAVLSETLEKFFPWRAEPAATWCGIEPAKYWQKMGQELEIRRMFGPAPTKYEVRLTPSLAPPAAECVLVAAYSRRRSSTNREGRIFFQNENSPLPSHQSWCGRCCWRLLLAQQARTPAYTRTASSSPNTSG